MIKEIEIVIRPDDISDASLITSLIAQQLDIEASSISGYTVLKRSIDARTAKLLCMNCGAWTKQIRLLNELTREEFRL